MCGIAGVWFNPTEGNDSVVIHQMTDALVHRGPDAAGHWTNGLGLYLGHRRLAILDLDPRSNQPFEWLDRFVITYNGEIYNFIEVRKELQHKGYFFRTHSDTEVLAAAYNEWGENCLSKLDGMFAFALFDKRNQTLFCARDRYGEKPFYYTIQDGQFYFASEMKAFWALGLPKTPREQMIYHFLADDLVEDVEDATGTFFEGIYKLASSHCFVYKPGSGIQQKRYYQLSTETTFEGSFEQAVAGFQERFYHSVERRMRADVALGSSLSGGMDSSALTAVMHQIQAGNATFSARFNDFDKDEGHFIDLVNGQLGTCAFSVYPTVSDLERQLDSLIYHQEEPFQTGSIFAQYKVYELARHQKHLVVLDGQGADELLGGYFMYLLPYYYELPISKRKAFLANMQQQQGVNVHPTWSSFLQFKTPRLFNSLHLHKHTIQPHFAPGLAVSFAKDHVTSIPFKTFSNLKESLKYSLTSQGLEKLLRFSDRNAMAHSVEARLPFLSHELVEYVMSLPSSYFFHGGWTKSVLRHSVSKELSDAIVWRKDKVGFEAPQDVWMHSAGMKDFVLDARSDLINRKWISNDYQSDWKMVVLAKIMADAR